MKKILPILLLLLVPLTAVRAAQLQDGEQFNYTLYFNWKFVWIKAGTASLTTRAVTYQWQSAYETTLYAASSKSADALYHLSDTLQTTVSPDGMPLYFVKHCEEGSDVVYERAWYSRTPDGRYRADLRKDYPDGRVRTSHHEDSKPIYDMVSIIHYARSLSFDRLTVGQRLTFPIVDSKRVINQTLIYWGRQQIKSQSGSMVTAHAFSLSGPDPRDANAPEKEILRLYLTDDARHIPAQIDINFRFGSAKAKLNGL